ncbi:pilus assembly protein [Xenorhabdus sp. Vera]|uniref:MrpH family fimbial adhesin n=1 Tax=Xenorhabdus koppenhoeferi TaxID=351659 RepID=UPI00199DA7FB|nr:pilus assembly protein [Xenorhabdus sp. Vera]MBD2810429.1 pilus assembly protein [Xenorhabdus sp. Vera]
MCHIKKSLLKLVALLFLLSATQVYGGAYVMPISIEEERGQTYATMEIIAWTEEEGIPNPCYGWSQCYVGPDVQYQDNNPGMQGACKDTDSCLKNAHLYQTTADVMRAYKKKFALPFKTRFPIMPLNSKCVGLFYANRTFPGFGDARQYPGSTCGKLPPPKQVCEISVPSEIAYGELTAPEVNNATRSVTGQVRCKLTGEIEVLGMSKDRQEKIYLDSEQQLYSTLQINDKEGLKGARIFTRKGYVAQNFTLTSKLHALSQPKAGKYEGTAIILLSYN